MMIEVLSPGMQHCQKANASAQVSGIARDSSQGFGGGAEQDARDQPLVLERQGREPLGQRENHMEVLNRQQLSGTLFEPLRSSSLVALRTMAIVAPAERKKKKAVPIALVDMTTQ